MKVTGNEKVSNVGRCSIYRGVQLCRFHCIQVIQRIITVHEPLVHTIATRWGCTYRFITTNWSVPRCNLSTRDCIRIWLWRPSRPIAVPPSLVECWQHRVPSGLHMCRLSQTQTQQISPCEALMSPAPLPYSTGLLHYDHPQLTQANAHSEDSK